MIKDARTKNLVEGALCVALSVVLSYLKIFNMPQGGSITLEMAPLFFFAFRRGWRWGCIVGGLSGFLQLIFGGYIVHPAQAILDYPLAFACAGIAGASTSTALRAFTSTAVASCARLACHVLSGVIFFSSYAPKGTNVWLYSLVYNATFLVPCAVASFAVAMILWKRTSAARV